MSTLFHKMHGLGNDFVIFDCRHAPIFLTSALIRSVADRRTGVGCDQLVMLEPSSCADLFMRIFNPDGSEAGACGNAARCVAALVGNDCQIETKAGVLDAVVSGSTNDISVDMGCPSYDWESIPLAEPTDTLFLPLPGSPAAMSIGNPHVTFFVTDIEHYPVALEGPTIENHPLFSQRANVGFAEIIDRRHIRLKVWERGAGLTQACGSGACATLVNAVRRDLSDRSATITLDGGDLHIEWLPNGHVLMTGKATYSFNGQIDLSVFAS